MIGVSVAFAERDAAREFFELCKTPWEFCRDNQTYDVVLGTGKFASPGNPRLTLICGDTATAFAEGKISVGSRREGMMITYGKRRMPLYGAAVTFPESKITIALDEKTREPVIHAQRAGSTTEVRIGFNPFEEIRHLLTKGQPVENAGIPTLELHFQLLRELITRAGIPFVEIPPIPAGHRFIACLTHDIDHPVLRNHCGDATMLGFFYRATVGSLINTCRGKTPLGRTLRNWFAAIKLPLVYLRLAPDFWRSFDRYLQIEAGKGATYFFIPEKGSPGRRRQGPSPAKRACRYTLEELAPQLNRITASGNEVGLHGLNAWIDHDTALGEKARISQITGEGEIGVRMHWLYFDEASPAVLDAAGFSYDSTVGYNQTIGFRAGTTQVYRPLTAKNLMELPLHAMDTALFYPDYLNLKEDEAYRRTSGLLDDFKCFGGAFTINWHDRSIAPERLWEEFYLRILAALSQQNAWFATGTQAVAWFRHRRSAVIESVVVERDAVRVRGRLTKLDSVFPGLRIRVHRPHISTPGELLAVSEDTGFVDTQFNETADLHIAL